MIGDVKQFMDGLELHFGAPRLAEDLDSTKFYKDYGDTLGKYSNKCLELASKKLIIERDKRSFPMLKECWDACREVHNRLVLEGMAAENAEGRAKKLDQKEAHEGATRLICSPIGRQAAEDGWIVGMYDFCLENQRYPNLQESERIRRKSASTWADLERWENDPATASNPMAWIKTFKKRRAHLSQIARGRIAA